MRTTPVLVASLCLIAACGETVNYDTQEKLVNDAALEGPSDNLTPGDGDGTAGGGAPSGSDGDGSGSGGGDITDGLGGDAINPETGVPFACEGGNIQSRNSLLVFPEIAPGTTCSFGTAPNLSRLNGYFRAYMTQTQVVDLPKGALLCGFALQHKAEKMRYDDEMFFSVNDKLLLATKDYSEFLPDDGFFHRFSWDGMKNQVYDSLDSRPVYCAGGSVGMSSCKVPATETQGSIEMTFSKDLNQKLATALQKQEQLRFEWTTTGDNDDSDCRHSPINLEVSIQYVLP